MTCGHPTFHPALSVTIVASLTPPTTILTTLRIHLNKDASRSGHGRCFFRGVWDSVTPPSLPPDWFLSCNDAQV